MAEKMCEKGAGLELRVGSVVCSIVDDWTPGLVREYGPMSGISKEVDVRGITRYRVRDHPESPGRWVAKKDVFSILVLEAYSNLGTKLAGNPKPNPLINYAAAAA